MKLCWLSGHVHRRHPCTAVPPVGSLVLRLDEADDVDDTDDVNEADDVDDADDLDDMDDTDDVDKVVVGY